MSSVEDYAAALAAEYGTYVATQPIVINGVRAYNEGNPVPVSNVEQYGYAEQGLVRRTDEPAPEPVVAPEPAPLPEGDPVLIEPTVEHPQEG